MLINRNSKLTLIHTAKRSTGLSDEEYRLLLVGAAGVSSAKDIKHEGQFRRVMEEFRKLGFVSTAAQKAQTKYGVTITSAKAIKGQARPKRNDWWRCTEPQRAKIEALAALVLRNQSPEGIRHFAARIAKVDNLSWLTTPLATKVITALMAMARSQGYDPDTGERHEEAQPCG